MSSSPFGVALLLTAEATRQAFSVGGAMGVARAGSRRYLLRRNRQDGDHVVHGPRSAPHEKPVGPHFPEFYPLRPPRRKGGVEGGRRSPSEISSQVSEQQ